MHDEEEQKKKMKACYTELEEAIKKNNVAGVVRFLGTKLDINHIDDKGWAPLHYAAMHGNCEIIETLILNGAHVDIRSKEKASWSEEGELYPGQTPLHCALYRPPPMSSQRAILDFIEERGQPSPDDEKTRLDKVNTLLERHALPTIADDKNRTPSQLAEIFSYHKIAERLNSTPAPREILQ